MIEHYQNDKSTIFSIVPFNMTEFKPGLYPGLFRIPACLDDKEPVQFIVGASEHLKNVPDSPRPERLVTPSFVVANSIVNDFLDGQLWSTPEAQPGMCYFQGVMSTAKFKVEHKEKHAEMITKQKAWFVSLVKQTDNEWKKYQNSRVVSDQARWAAKYLGLEPDWLTTEVVGFGTEKCPACGTPNDRRNAVCTTCRCILDKEKYKTLSFAS